MRSWRVRHHHASGDGDRCHSTCMWSKRSWAVHKYAPDPATKGELGMTAPNTTDVGGSPDDPWAYEKLRIGRQGSVVFVEIAAPPMNLQGPELVRDLVSL